MNNLEIKINPISTESYILETFQQSNNKNNKNLVLYIDVHSSLGSQLMKTIQEQLQLFSTLEDLTIIISQQCIFAQQEYFTLGDGLSQLQTLKRLSIQIEDFCLVNSEFIFGLSSGIKKLTSLIDLEVKIKENNDLGEFGCTSLRESIECLSHLKKLSISIGRKCQICNKSISNIFECIKQLVNLEELKLSVDISMLNELSIVELSESINPLQNLSSLVLMLEVESFNNTNLFLIFKSIKALKYIRVFQFEISHYQTISQEDMYSISSDLSQLINIEELSITNLFDSLSQECSLELFKSLSKMEKLKSLTLNLSNLKEINEESQYQIGNYLKNLKNLNSLSLNIYRKFIYQDQFIYELIDSLQVMKQLKSLSLCFSSKVCARDCLRFFQILQEFKNLNDFYININENFDIRKESIEQFAQSLKSLTNLNEFNLNCHQSVNFSPIMLSLQNLKQLRNLTLSLHQICSIEILFNLGISLQQISSLQSADILLSSPQQFDEQSLLHIFKGLKNQNELKVLKLETLLIELVNLEEIQSFFEVFQYCNKLQEIKINISYLLNNQMAQQLGETLLNLVELEQVEFTFAQQTSMSQLTKILQGIQSIKLKKLTLIIETIIMDDNLAIDQNDNLSLNIFSHFTNLEYLNLIGQTVQENFKMNIYKIFINSIQSLKSLKSLEINLESYIVVNNDIFEGLAICFNQLKNLQKLNLNLCINDYQITTQGVYNFYNGLLSLKSLKDIQFIIYSKYNFVKQLLYLIHQLENISTVYVSLNDNYYHEQEEIGNQKSENLQLTQYAQLQTQEASKQFDFTNTCKIQKLSVIETSSRDTSKLQFKDFFQNLKFYKYLREFYLNFNTELEINNDELQEFNNSLSYLSNLEEIYLNFYSDINFSFEVLDNFATSISQLTKLQKFTFNVEKGFTNNSDGMCSIMKSISYLKNLKYFSIDFINEIGKQPVIILGESLSNLKELQKFFLNIQNSKESMEEGVKSLGIGLQNTSQLQHLSLFFGDEIIVGDIGAISLGKGISNLNKLTDIGITINNCTNITDSGCSEIFKSLSKLKILLSLQIQFKSRSLVSWESLQHISLMFSKLKFLSYIQIDIEIDCKQIEKSPIQIFEFYQYKNIQNCSFCIFERQGLCCQYSVNQISFQLNFQIKFYNLFKEKSSNEIQLLMQTLEYLPSQANIDIKFNGRISSQDYMNFCHQLLSFKSQDILITIGDRKLQDAQSILGIANSLSQMKTLQKLALRIYDINKITRKTALQLAESLSKCNQISKLKISIQQQNDFDSTDYFQFLCMLTNMKRLRSLYVSSEYYLNSHILRQKAFQSISKKNKYLVVLKVNEFYDGNIFEE